MKGLIRKIGLVVLMMVPVLSVAMSNVGKWIVAPSVGYLRYASKRHLDSQGMPGGSLGYVLTPSMTSELYFGRIMTNRSREPKRDVRGGLVMLDGFYHFRSTKTLQPYLLAGIGAMHMDPAKSHDPDMEANLNVGAGISYFFSPQIALRIDMRDLYTMNGGRNDYMMNGAVVVYLGSGATQTVTTDQPSEDEELEG